jgi:hypothetical protein
LHQRAVPQRRRRHGRQGRWPPSASTGRWTAGLRAGPGGPPNSEPLDPRRRSEGVRLPGLRSMLRSFEGAGSCRESTFCVGTPSGAGSAPSATPRLATREFTDGGGEVPISGGPAHAAARLDRLASDIAVDAPAPIECRRLHLQETPPRPTRRRWLLGRAAGVRFPQKCRLTDRSRTLRWHQHHFPVGLLEASRSTTCVERFWIAPQLTAPSAKLEVPASPIGRGLGSLGTFRSDPLSTPESPQQPLQQ